MLVPNASGLTIHFKSGKSIHFSEGEFAIQHIKTVQWNADGTESVTVEYYLITTTMEERFIANAGTGELEG